MNQKGFIYAGNLLQTVNYYPSGVPFTLTDDDPVTDRLHTGKPFIDMQGLGYYDNNARFLDILTGSFISVDPLAGKYPSLTPYNHCANNPLILIDPDGRDVWHVNNHGYIMHTEKSTDVDKFIMVDNEGNILKNKEGEELSISFKYGTVISQKTYDYKLKEENEIRQYDVYKVRGDDNAKDLFEFMSENITGSESMVEVSLTQTGVSGERGLNFIATGHYPCGEPGLTSLWKGQLRYGYYIRSISHSHPNYATASEDDFAFAEKISEARTYIIRFNIYHVKTKQYITF